MKADEMVLLLADKKPVVRQGFHEEEFRIIQKFCLLNKVSWARSKFKVLFSDEESGSFSNKGIIIPEHDRRDAVHFYYFSKKEEDAYLASFYELMGNDQALGLLLGYPGCCTEFFEKSFSGNSPNPTHENPDPYLDLSQREQDLVLISHFPCSPTCEKSILLARNNFMLLKQHFPKRAKELKRKLGI